MLKPRTGEMKRENTFYKDKRVIEYIQKILTFITVRLKKILCRQELSYSPNAETSDITVCHSDLCLGKESPCSCPVLPQDCKSSWSGK